jgi:catechol 2,3-dioxygenase-like lactoylglutathione lyase family enzyme
MEQFYRAVLQLEPRGRVGYREGGSVMLEFQVGDVDAEFARLRGSMDFPIDFVLEPTTLKWGNRSIYFRDPDGNVVNFFTPVDS